MGGYWGLALNISFDNNQCPNELQTLSKCDQKEQRDRDYACFATREEIFGNYSQEIFPTKDIKIVEPDIQSAWLPFPNLFNVTIIDVIPITGCEWNPVACHIITENDCMFYKCHSTNNTWLFQVTIEYEIQALRVNMILMCHDTASKCHFVTPETNFFICKDDSS